MLPVRGELQIYGVNKACSLITNPTKTAHTKVEILGSRLHQLYRVRSVSLIQ